MTEVPGGGDSQLLTHPILNVFVESVKNGKPDQVVGVFVDGVMASRVTQQPADDPGWVSNKAGDATQFHMAYEVAGNIGLLAHNYLVGQAFFFLQPGQVASLVYGDGSVTDYEITEIRRYQALTPSSATSNFLDLSSNQTLTAADLFNQVYAGDHHLTFQTCIQQDNNAEWGRLFVLARPQR